MTLSAFADRSRRPDAAALRATLGRSHALWSRLVAQAGARCPGLVQQWHLAGAASGWSLRLRHRERNLLYLIPGAGRFLVGIVLGERAIAAAGALSKAARVRVDAAPRYAEGVGIRMPVATAADLSVALELFALKVPGASGTARRSAGRRPRRPLRPR